MGTLVIGNFKYTNLTYNLFYYFIVAVLLFSGITKIIDPLPMIETINHVPVLKKLTEIFPFGEVWWGFLPIIEIALGLMLVLKIQTMKTLIITTVLFFCFFVFSVYGTVISLSNDCGCFGNTLKSQFNWLMILRNLIFLIASILIYKKIRSPLLK